MEEKLEQLLKRLDEEAEEYADNEAAGNSDDVFWAYNNGFKAGAYWLLEEISK